MPQGDSCSELDNEFIRRKTRVLKQRLIFPHDIRYVTRPAVAEQRLKLQPNGDIVLRLKTKYSDGTTHLLFSGLEFVEKLAALVAPPRIHLTRFFGCLAPHSKIRSQIVPKKTLPPSVLAPEPPSNSPPIASKRSKAMSWAELLARVFTIDMKTCPRCPGQTLLPIEFQLKKETCNPPQQQLRRNSVFNLKIGVNLVHYQYPRSGFCSFRGFLKSPRINKKASTIRLRRLEIAFIPPIRSPEESSPGSDRLLGQSLWQLTWECLRRNFSFSGRASL